MSSHVGMGTSVPLVACKRAMQTGGHTQTHAPLPGFLCRGGAQTGGVWKGSGAFPVCAPSGQARGKPRGGTTLPPLCTQGDMQLGTRVNQEVTPPPPPSLSAGVVHEWEAAWAQKQCPIPCVCAKGASELGHMPKPGGGVPPPLCFAHTGGTQMGGCRNRRGACGAAWNEVCTPLLPWLRPLST